MKKVLLLIVMAIIGLQTAQANVSRYVSRYFDKGTIYSGSSFPVDTAKNADQTLPTNENLKYGEATTNNILGIVEIGDRGIQAAAKNGGITRIHYVDTKVSKVYIPLLFIPIYVKQTKTIVYGE